EVDRVAKADCRSAAAIRTMTSSTVLPVKEIEIYNLARWDHLRVRSGPPWRVFQRTAACCSQRQHGEQKVFALHRRSSSLPSFSITPGASIPARMMNGKCCQVRTRSCRETTIPATTPNPTCESTNQNQSIRWLSTGLTIPRML